MTTFTILGSVEGGLWWPYRAPAEKPVNYSFERSDEPRPFVSAATTLRDAVEDLMTQEGGDFSSALLLSADSLLLVTRRGATHETRRWFSLASFASISDYVTGGAS